MAWRQIGGSRGRKGNYLSPVGGKSDLNPGHFALQIRRQTLLPIHAVHVCVCGGGSYSQT